VEVRIEKLVYGGDGLAHQDGQTVFVPQVLPGELVQIEVTSRKKKIAWGRVQRIVEPSPDRVPPRCPYFGQCGGCQYQHIPYEAQLRFKTEILRETLSRIGGVRWDGEIATHPSPPFGYRNRTQWKVRPERSNGQHGTRIGYFEAGSTRFCAVDQCPIASPKLEQTLTALNSLSASGELAGADEIEAFADAADEKVLLNISAGELTGSPEGLASALRSALPGAETILVHDRHTDKFELFGDGFLLYSTGGFDYRVGHLSFFQVNHFLIEIVTEAVTADARGRLALDLFAGVGLFTVPLARRFERVIGVESNLAAAKDLETNLRASGGASPTSRHATAESFLSRWHDTPDLVVLDPPRAGVEPSALARLKQLAPRQITYLSCDPATLARDLSTLVDGREKAGPYEITAIYLFDIFPQSYHMEALVRLRRRV
jgi:23S rRNA (uracil1939-C5)-methyltransferase